MISSVSLQYAKALFDLALEKNEVDSVFENLKIIDESFKKNNDITKLFISPDISNDEKKRVLKQILNLEDDNYFLYFFYVLIDNSRIEELHNILEAFKKYVNEYLQILDVRVYTKYELSIEQKDVLIEKLTKHFAKKLNINYQIDDKLIAGIRVYANDTVIDYALDSKFKKLKETIMKG